MKKIIRKSTVIRALKTEPLGATGCYIEFGDGTSVRAVSEARATKKDCAFCAVGAVLRDAGLTLRQVEAVGGRSVASPMGFLGNQYPSDWKEARKAAQNMVASAPLSALSSLYEYGMDSDIRLPELRRRLVAFVDKYFPKTVVLDTRAARPGL